MYYSCNHVSWSIYFLHSLYLYDKLLVGLISNMWSIYGKMVNTSYNIRHCILFYFNGLAFFVNISMNNLCLIKLTV